MPDTGWLDFTTFASVAGTGDVSWTDPGKAISADADPVIAASVGNDQASEYLRASGADFSVIPVGASIIGIIARLRVSTPPSSTGSVVDELVQLSIGGVLIAGSDNKASLVPWHTAMPNDAYRYRTYGSSVDTWMAGLTRTDLADLELNVQVRVQAGGDWALLDHMQVRIYYRRRRRGRM